MGHNTDFVTRIANNVLYILTDGQVAEFITLAERYGELDGEIVYYYATHFAEVGRSLTDAQREGLWSIRDLEDYPCNGAYLYSENIDMPEIGDTGFLFDQP